MKVIAVNYCYIMCNNIEQNLINLGPELSQINLTNTSLVSSTAVSLQYFELRGK